MFEKKMDLEFFVNYQDKSDKVAQCGGQVKMLCARPL